MKVKLQKGLFKGTFPISQYFGENPEAYDKFGMGGHNGIDYAIPSGTELLSCGYFQVTEIEYDKSGYGKYIKLENERCGVLYAHMKTLSTLKLGTEVVPGDLLGESGNTGNSTGPHLHFAVFPKPRDRSNGYAGYINPFDKDLVEWVDSLEDSDGKEEIAELERKIGVLQVEIVKWKGERDEKDRKYEREKEEHYKTKTTKDEQIGELLTANKQLNDAALNRTHDLNLLRTEKAVAVADLARERKLKEAADRKVTKLEKDLSNLTEAYNKLKSRKEEQDKMKENNQKIWYASKTLWVNLLAVSAIVIQSVTGEMWLSADFQVSLLAMINLLLRVITKEEIVWN